MMTDAETTETTIADVVDNPEETIAVDIAQVLKEASPVEQQGVKIVKVKPLEASEYVDPIEQAYIIQRENHIETPDFRNSKQGIAMIHETICFIGDQPYP